MRLLHTKTRELQEFGQPPFVFKYAVLSHTRSEGEALYNKTTVGRQNETRGLEKVYTFCKIAADNGCDYCWLDSYCIDASDPSEGNEAIVSTYAWFKHAHLCCVYLTDVGSLEDLNHAKWFKRTWSLVELLAPEKDKMQFYTTYWEALGDKMSLAARISEITSIPRDVLTHESDPISATIGEKLSWASKRQAAKEEEHVYALISLLGVRMATNYGEGKAMATVRMQEQILTNLEDYTVLMLQKPLGLATQRLDLPQDNDPERTMVIPQWNEMTLISPIDLRSIKTISRYLPRLEKPPDSPQLTARGLRVTLFTKQVRDFLIAWTYCIQQRGGSPYAVCIRVLPTGIKTGSIQHHLRGSTSGLVCYVTLDRLRSFELKDIYFKTD
jgi:hypothetical protein